MSRNAKQELLEIIKNKSLSIKCAEITFGDTYDEEYPPAKYSLPVNYDTNTFDTFIDSLNFNYDSGFGSQLLFGTVWLTDGTWLSRREYDGSEWWVHNVMPEIPISLLKNNKP